MIKPKMSQRLHATQRRALSALLAWAVMLSTCPIPPVWAQSADLLRAPTTRQSRALPDIEVGFEEETANRAGASLQGSPEASEEHVQHLITLERFLQMVSGQESIRTVLQGDVPATIEKLKAADAEQWWRRLLSLATDRQYRRDFRGALISALPAEGIIVILADEELREGDGDVDWVAQSINDALGHLSEMEDLRRLNHAMMLTRQGQEPFATRLRETLARIANSASDVRALAALYSSVRDEESGWQWGDGVIVGRILELETTALNAGEAHLDVIGQLLRVNETYPNRLGTVQRWQTYQDALTWWVRRMELDTANALLELTPHAELLATVLDRVWVLFQEEERTEALEAYAADIRLAEPIRHEAQARLREFPEYVIGVARRVASIADAGVVSQIAGHFRRVELSQAINASLQLSNTDANQQLRLTLQERRDVLVEDEVPSWLSQARTHHARGELAEASALLERALNVHPGLYEARHLLQDVRSALRAQEPEDSTDRAGASLQGTAVFDAPDRLFPRAIPVTSGTAEQLLSSQILAGGV